jgi:tetratricopeptide (TPR) repeat protein
MAKKNKQDDEILVDLETKVSSAEAFLQKNKTIITSIFAAVIIGVGGYLAFTSLYLGPKEKDAQFELYLAQELFEEENFLQSIEGDGNALGFLAIMEDYRWTKAANLAKYYTGVAYLNLGDFKNAISYLDKFSTNDDILSVVSKGAIGDAFMELNQLKDALDYYTKASNQSTNSLVVPIYLERAGQTAVLLEDNKKAMRFYERIVNEFPESREAANAKKMTAKLTVK